MATLVQSELTAALREALSVIPVSPEQKKNFTNEVIASMFTTVMDGRMLYDESIASFWFWHKQGYWIPITHPDDFRRSLSIALVKWGQRGLTVSKMDDMIAQIRLQVERVDDLGGDYICFKDTLWSPETGETAEKKPENVATLYIDANYSDIARAAAPKFLKYIEETCVKEDGSPNPGMAAQLQEFAGYLLWPSIEICPCLFFYGEGSNGKSVFIDVLRGLVGDKRTSACGLEHLVGNKFGMSSLVGVRFNASDEMGNLREATTENFKKMVFGETVHTERKFGNAFDFKPKAKHIFCTNQIPAFKEVNMAIKRRILIIPFYRTLDPFSAEGRKSVVRNYGKKLVAEELPGIVAWAMAGLERLKQQDFWFTTTDESKELMHRFEEESSSIIEYLREHYEQDEESRMASSAAYDGYVTWCKEVGRKATSRISFGRDFSEVFGKPLSTREGDKFIKAYRCRKKGFQPPTAYTNPFL